MVWPLTEWGAGQSPAKATDASLPEQNAFDNTPVPAGAHVYLRGNIFAGYTFEVIGQED
jgi:hypothetical protein